MTEKLFDNGWLLEFDATVISCTEKDGEFEIELDRTAFAPEGGGQLSDIGYIDGTFVKDVQQRESTIIHITDTAISVGATVVGKVDCARRVRHIQGRALRWAACVMNDGMYSTSQ